MPDKPLERSSTTGALPIDVSLGPSLENVNAPTHTAVVDSRIAYISVLAIVVAGVSTVIAEALIWLIHLATNIFFFGRWSGANVPPWDNHLGLWVIAIPVIGGLLVGIMARWGSPAIRGHGIPEAMEQILLNESRIPPRITFLKPFSAALSIGSGGPFGAEGPIIATGGAIGSLVGQLLKTTADERKTLLAAGAAAGMTAVFGCPVSAVLLAIELLLFEYRARSFIPVALASAMAAGMRGAYIGWTPIFAMPHLANVRSEALIWYAVLGAIVGLASVYVTRAVYAIEDAFEHLPVHWMWWPAIGAVAVGVLGYFFPHTLGVGYSNIDDILGGAIVGKAVIVLFIFKFISWAIALGSGTSGGTLAPLMTIGGGLGSALGALLARIPGSGVDFRLAALVGMAALFAGASRALLTSIVFAFETTRQPISLLPLLIGCTVAFFVSAIRLPYSIMTLKIERRGTRVPGEYGSDYLGRVLVANACTRNVSTLKENDKLQKVRQWIVSRSSGSGHQGFPIVSTNGKLIGVVTRRDIFDDTDAGDRTVKDIIKRPLAVVYDDNSLREAADHMVRVNTGRLPVVTRIAPDKVVGIITRGDLLTAQQQRLQEQFEPSRSIHFSSRLRPQEGEK
ncbi:MAG: chloride channel protein [Acidobacteriaceae bacterium]